MTTQEKTYNSKFHELLNDDLFWRQYTFYTVNTARLSRIREHRSRGTFPRRSIFIRWVEEDYKPITGDNRTTQEISLELTSPTK